MKRKEFIRSTIAMIGRMLDVWKETSQSVHLIPMARLGALTMNLNRNSKMRPEPFTIYDFMPELGPAPPDPDARNRALMKSKQMFYEFKGKKDFVTEIETEIVLPVE